MFSWFVQAGTIDVLFPCGSGVCVGVGGLGGASVKLVNLTIVNRGLTLGVTSGK